MLIIANDLSYIIQMNENKDFRVECTHAQYQYSVGSHPLGTKKHPVRDLEL